MNPQIAQLLAARGCTEAQLARTEPRTISVNNIGRANATTINRDAHYIYVGRWSATQLGFFRFPIISVINSLGNPHPVTPYRCRACNRLHTRTESIGCFANNLARDAAMQAAAWNMMKVIVQTPCTHIILLCHCSPLACHADVLARKVVQYLPNFTLV